MFTLLDIKYYNCLPSGIFTLCEIQVWVLIQTKSGIAVINNSQGRVFSLMW